MNYKQAITNNIHKLSQDKRTVFIGYNTACGSRMYGTLNKVPKKQCIETPVCENLMVGLGLGMSLTGYKPIICFERHDFLLIALDAIINHMKMMPILSNAQFNFPVILRTIVGHDKPLDPGIQHKQDYTDILLNHSNADVHMLCNTKQVTQAYQHILKYERPVVLVEYKKLY